MIQGTKIVACEEMERLEKLAILADLSIEELMNRAAEALASIIEDWFKISHAPPNVTLLVGKGNKGGDALSTGALLLKRGFNVTAFLVYPQSMLSSLCLARLRQFEQVGGIIHHFHLGKRCSDPFIIDGIAGTGFHGTPDEPMKAAIEWANTQEAALLAIDLPSGLDGTTGVVESVAIQATLTCCLGLPKIGCFIGQGWDHAGELLIEDIGIPHDIISQGAATALLLKKESLQLPPLVRTRHKYEAGYVIGLSGSPEMPGAAALSSLAALRTGAGIVRLFTLPETPRTHFAPEVICETADLSRLEEEIDRADSLFIGPGLGRSSKAQTLFQKLLPLLTKPTVIDGDGLYHLALLSSFSLPSDSILTPHHREMSRLLGAPPTLESCQRWVEKHQTLVVLKGAPTILFHPARRPLIITTGDPGMATAGAGDVLTGMIAALLAQKTPGDEAAALGVYLHGRAGELAADSLTSYGLIASDLISHLPAVFRGMISKNP